MGRRLGGRCGRPAGRGIGHGFGAGLGLWLRGGRGSETREGLCGERRDLSGVNSFLVDPYGTSLTTSTGDKAINKLSTVTVSIIKDTQNTGNLECPFQLADPVQAGPIIYGR